MPESLPGSTTALRVQLATALRERDEARALKLEEVMGATKRVCDERDAANARADAANSKLAATDVERLQALSALAAARRECDLRVKALEKYGCHHNACGAVPNEDDAACDCGLSAALAAPAAASGEEKP